MADKTPFVINDRRKFTTEGELRPGVELSPEPPAAPAEQSAPQATHGPIAFPSPTSEPGYTPDAAKSSAAEPIAFPSTGSPDDQGGPTASEEEEDTGLPPAPSAEQSAQASRAYASTVDRLDTAIRASNPGADRIPEMTFDRFVQSLYMQAIIQIGGAAESGQTPQVDILGARQTIDMLSILADKTKGNLTPAQDKMVQSVLFEARMGFLEVTQALARQNDARRPGAPGSPGGGGPRVVR